MPFGRNSVTSDEQRAEREQPDLGQRAGEPALGAVDDDRAERRADQRAAPADRDPDHDLDRVGRRELARVDDADLRHVERAGDAASTAETVEDEELVVLDAVAEEARRGSRRRGSRSAPCRASTSTMQRAMQEAARPAPAPRATNSAARVAGAWTSKPRMSLKSVRPLLPPKPMSLRKKASSRA